MSQALSFSVASMEKARGASRQGAGRCWSEGATQLKVTVFLVTTKRPETERKLDEKYHELNQSGKLRDTIKLITVGSIIKYLKSCYIAVTYYRSCQYRILFLVTCTCLYSAIVPLNSNVSSFSKLSSICDQWVPPLPLYLKILHIQRQCFSLSPLISKDHFSWIHHQLHSWRPKTNTCC